MLQEGPTLPISKELHSLKYTQPGEEFREAMSRIAHTLCEGTPSFFEYFRRMLLSQAFLPAGRNQSALGATRKVTPYNCFVLRTIPDSMEGIMDVAKESALTMKLGGGVGYDFSTLRPNKDTIVSLDSPSSGPVSFMGIFDALCSTISSAGRRRGAQMAVLRVDHPDIEEFIHAKQNVTNLTNFNISVGITKKFMMAVKQDLDFDLEFNGRVYRTVRAKALWDMIMRSTWDWAEPGVLFLDTINDRNNLWYCETIAATNPCAEQPLPPNGACLLGSFNMVKYLNVTLSGYEFDYERFRKDIPVAIRAMDNVVDEAIYPLPAQEHEAKSKRRMGIGVTGMANAIEALSPFHLYGSPLYIKEQDKILEILRNEAYRASALLAKEKGSFPLFDRDQFAASHTFGQLPTDIQFLILEHGIRNSHLISIAPTGTISLTADNVSSGIEPVFSYGFDRTMQLPTGTVVEHVSDYGFRELGTKGRIASECSVEDHLNVLISATKWVDSAVSKTCNVGDDVTYDEFKEIYMKAWENGCKGCTTFRASGKRMGILKEASTKPVDEPVAGAACYIDPETGTKTCE